MCDTNNRYLIATTKSWNIERYEQLKNKYSDLDFALVSSNEELSVSFLESFKPKYIFFPHWSWIIPDYIYNRYDCVVFHSTDLPFGRGGSPIQNLIVRGIYNTKISAIKVCSGIDTGPIYFKESIDISEGNADQIFSNISEIIFDKMIPRFFDEELIPLEQQGEVVSFSRRKPEQSELPKGLSSRQIYDYIRMLDGEGYPPAYINIDNGRIYFFDAEYDDGHVIAKVRIITESEEQ